MQTATKGNTTWTYTYNADGLRIGKTNGTTTTTYTWNENRQLSSMTWNTGSALFYYDADGIPYAVQNYDAILDVERTYLYVTNLQGDVLSIIDASSGATAVTYTYDAWGRLVGKDGTSSDYASIYEYNPLTYRGYIYDSETGFYYLQSRYYDPTIGRFLNADDTAFLGASGTLLSWNLFVYCENNSVTGLDPSGYAAFSAVRLAQQLTPYGIFAMYAGILLENLAQGLLKIGIYVTRLITPIAAKAFWWKPWLIAGVVVAAVAIITTAILAIHYSEVNSIKRNLSDIARQYGPYECEKAAKAMKRYAKNRGKIIHLYFPNAYNGYVCCDRYNWAISENGHHYGYLYNGIVYCNIYLEGRPVQSWINSFYDAGGGRPIVTYM